MTIYKQDSLSKVQPQRQTKKSSEKIRKASNKESDYLTLGTGQRQNSDIYSADSSCPGVIEAASNGDYSTAQQRLIRKQIFNAGGDSSEEGDFEYNFKSL